MGKIVEVECHITVKVEVPEDWDNDKIMTEVPGGITIEEKHYPSDGLIEYSVEDIQEDWSIQ